MAVKKTERVVVPNVRIGRGHVETVKFRRTRKTGIVRVRCGDMLPLVIRPIGEDDKPRFQGFIAGFRKEASVEAKSPEKAFAKAVRAYWS